MKNCNHNEILIFLAQDKMLADGICPICLQEKFAQAVKVIEAAEKFLDSTDAYSAAEYQEDLREAVEKFKGEKDDKHRSVEKR